MDGTLMATPFVIGPTVRIIEDNCLNCGKKLDGTFNVGGADIPREGDFSICCHCGHVMTYGKNLRLQELTEKDIREIAGDENLLVAQKLVAEYNRRRDD